MEKFQETKGSDWEFLEESGLSFLELCGGRFRKHEKDNYTVTIEQIQKNFVARNKIDLLNR